jgi:ATPase subunit of ABC transporter with duplicated ATPase domains
LRGNYKREARKREARSEKREARSEKREKRKEKREKRKEKREKRKEKGEKRKEKREKRKEKRGKRKGKRGNKKEGPITVMPMADLVLSFYPPVTRTSLRRSTRYNWTGEGGEYKSIIISNNDAFTSSHRSL